MTVAILDFGMCNLRSVMSAAHELGFDPEYVASDKVDATKFSHLILPGVGAFDRAMANICSRGLDTFITKFAASGKPILGICLGMQLLADFGEEGEGAKGLGLITGSILQFDKNKVQVPHIGWNNVSFTKNHPVFSRLKSDLDFYFVHSYFFAKASADTVFATTSYQDAFTSVVAKKNIVGTQFHPEKSQKNGLCLLESFLEWNGQC